MKHMIKSLVLASLVATLPSFSQAEQIIVTKEVNNQNIPVSVAENKQNLSKANKETLLKENNQNSFKDIKQDSPKDNKERSSKNNKEHSSKDTKERSSKDNQQSVVKDNKMAQSAAIQVIKEGLADSEIYGTRPIIVKSLYGTEEVRDEVAFKDQQSLWIPLALYKRVNLNPITTEQGTTYITLPMPRVGGDMLYSGDARGGTSKIKLPISVRNGFSYVDLKTMSPMLGVVYEERADGIVLTPQVGAVSKPDVKEITNTVTLVFDPLVGTPYAHKVAHEGTSVISPTLFDLGEKGLVVKNQVSLDYKLQYGAAGYQVWPLVTNTFKPDFTSKILKDETKWSAIGRDMVLYALAYGYEGYNFDFENVYYKDKKQLTKFVTYLADLLHNYNIKSSVDITGYSDSENWSMVYDRKAFGEAVDYVVLMAYDETWASSTTAGPVASYPWVRQNVEALLKEVPSEKVILGVPYYMRSWTSKIEVDAKGKVKISETKGKTLPMGEAEALKEKYKQRVTWNDKLKTNYVVFGTNRLGEQLLAYKETGREPRLVVPMEAVDSPNGVANTVTVSKVTSDKTKVVENNVADAKTLSKETNESMKESRIAGGLRNKSSFITEVWFEDEASMAPKLALVKELNLGGFGAWRKGFETEEFADFVYKNYKEPKEAEQDKKGNKKSDKKADKKTDKKPDKKNVKN
ncbi:MAG: glycosyl hydrolase family 18 protein [Veillonella caviae]|nr:glycosyl hydrolase family 18 protein [Veillonella caviae]